MCMHLRLCVMKSRDRCSLLEVLPLTLDPCESETCLCFQNGPPPSLLSLVWRGKEGRRGRTAGEVDVTAKGEQPPQSMKPHLSPFLHPSRLLTFTPDPVTPSSGLQQQQKQEIREIYRLEGITVALFILGCTHS